MLKIFLTFDSEYILQVSMDGKTFSTDGTIFQYYRVPEMTDITPGLCRPPFPRLRLDGEHICASEHLLVRFEEEEDSKEEDSNVVASTLSEDMDKRPPMLRSPSRRVFDVPGQVESELIKIDIDPETELPIYEERWFITCDSPPLLPQAQLPFISLVTIAPNGTAFEGTPLQFTAHDPHVDGYVPSAIPIPLPASVPAVGGEKPDGTGTLVCITGRNLYRSAGLTARLRFGSDQKSVVALDNVAFDSASGTITCDIPTVACAFIAGVGGTSAQEPLRPPAIGVAIEVSVDGEEYFTAPERLIMYSDPHLALKGDGLFPVAGGGWAELMTTELTFRGQDAKVST